jgi:hypothetical protein
VPFSIGAMVLFALIVWQALGFPEVEDPIPEKIGLELIFAFAGAGAVVGEVVRFGASPARRERAVRRCGLAGFCIGLGLYVLSLLLQVISAP